MIFILLMAAAFSLMDGFILVFNTENQGYFGSAFVVFDVLLLWPLAWSLALIGDAVGPRKLFRFTVVSCDYSLHMSRLRQRWLTVILSCRVGSFSMASFTLPLRFTSSSLFCSGLPFGFGASKPRGW